MDASRRRWWDGENWTGDVRTPITPTPTAEQPAVAQDVDDEEPSSGRSRLVTIGAIAALFVLAALAGFVMFGGGDDGGTSLEDASPGFLDTTTSAPSADAGDDTVATTVTEPDEPDAEPGSDAEAAPDVDQAYGACRVTMVESVLGDDGIDFQPTEEVDWTTEGETARVEFDATSNDDTQRFVCFVDLVDGEPVFEHLYLDMREILAMDEVPQRFESVGNSISG
jgi:hypothetical protein